MDAVERRERSQYTLFPGTFPAVSASGPDMYVSSALSLLREIFVLNEFLFNLVCARTTPQSRSPVVPFFPPKFV